jgi:hypothetical protein
MGNKERVLAMEKLNFEACAKLHWSAPPDRQMAALAAWWAVLAGRPEQPVREPRLTLKELGRQLHRHPSVLWRLGVVEHCGESFGAGRKLYRELEVVAYLTSPACAARRAELRAARRAVRKEQV